MADAQGAREERKSRWQSIKTKHTDATEPIAAPQPVQLGPNGKPRPVLPYLQKKIEKEKQEKEEAAAARKESDESVDSSGDSGSDDSSDEQMEDPQLKTLPPAELQKQLQEPKKPTDTIFQVVNKINQIAKQLDLSGDDQLKIESFFLMCANESKVLEQLNSRKGLWALPDGRVHWPTFAKFAMEIENQEQQIKLLSNPNIWQEHKDEEEDEHVRRFFSDKRKDRAERNKKIADAGIQKEKLKKARKKEFDRRKRKKTKRWIKFNLDV